MKIVVRSKNFLELSRLILSHEPIIYKYTRQLISNRFMGQNGRNRRIHPSTESANDVLIPDLISNVLNSTRDE